VLIIPSSWGSQLGGYPARISHPFKYPCHDREMQDPVAPSPVAAFGDDKGRGYEGGCGAKGGVLGFALSVAMEEAMRGRLNWLVTLVTKNTWKKCNDVRLEHLLTFLMHSLVIYIMLLKRSGIISTPSDRK
jgi:hypothetical protein